MTIIQLVAYSLLVAKDLQITTMFSRYNIHELDAFWQNKASSATDSEHIQFIQN